MLSTNQNVPSLEVGDIVFTCVAAYLFQSISKASLCWSNHVGIIIGHDGNDYLVAESCVPISKTTTLTKFVKRSHHKHYAIRRLTTPLSDQQKLAICSQVPQRLNILYHTGFKFDSKLQFCSKFVYEIYRDALQLELGKIETFNDLLKTNPNANLTFWKLWFFGKIPWQRKTVTPASLWFCPKLQTVYDSSPEVSQRFYKAAS
ncbi:YebB family permuted papain-like enzyme [Entomomonas sp. E2T0]|uniref:YebB family permuted papain-like enzyme n=1 Tax=Entomomonas sp. E2T0 TaxID=2930213 RepID=UPI002228231D|nr:YebB family permuted papain-like enzyme [Entomomonas sp. E2T0]UYZ85098.1 YebB family permuted papain-like enzyme [Entomomonas sp. E2T0]